MKDVNIQELRGLFGRLFDILEKYGDSTIVSHKITISKIMYLLNSDEKYDNLISGIRVEYFKLYPARGGISEFYIWSENYEERKSLNEPLDIIRERIWDILK